MWQALGIELRPRYHADPLIQLDGPPSAILEPAVRQRRRLADALSLLSEDQWRHPSRCDGWSGRDVIVHLDSTNRFWAFSAEAGVRGEPTTFLATFDPVASPAELVAGDQDTPSAEVLERFLASTSALEEVLTGLSDDDWTKPAESPPGHVSISTMAHHALWDSWVHERDVLLPLGIAVDEEPDEVVACLRYGAALAPAFALSNGDARPGQMAVSVTDPDLALRVEVGDHVSVSEGPAPDADVTITGAAVEVLEAFSVRRPLDQPVSPEWSWMVDGLAKQFDA